ncbi:hypothetical protein ACP70R_003992 [Stipagrostis hirtigluma subsp. patula]
MPCPPSMDANAAKKMSRGGGKKPSRSSSWMAMGFYYPSSSSGKGRSQAGSAEEGKDGGGGKKKRSISISRSMTCAGSICSTKESSVMSRDGGGGGGRSASSRSLKAPDEAASAAAISATSSFNSETTAATSTVTTSPSSPLSSALSSPLSSFGGSFRGVQIRKLSGCYECHSVLDPRSLAAAAAFPCADCDEVFVKAESLELHRATRHAVSELGPEDTSRNIVEIIFQSSWLRKQAPVCKIERILKVHNTDKTVKRFEQYKETIKEKASTEEGKKNPRCVADGNELLRFHCTTFTCALGAAGGTALCRAASTQCKLCGIIRDGFRVDGDGKIATMATSGRAHDKGQVSSDGEKRAMLVCRVVAGRVKKASGTNCSGECASDCDSVSPSSEGVYSDLDELFVFNPRAILPCFVVIYSGY